MRQALPKGLVKSNLSIPGREAANLDFLRAETEASSDSEVTRQALRHLEQLVEDEKHHVSLKVVKGTIEEVLASSRFRDRPDDTGDLIRRSLILHEQSAKRLQKLQVMMGAKDPSEVVRCALRFYDEIVRAAVEGARFFAVLPTGEQFGVRFGSFAAVEASSVAAGATSSEPRSSKPPGLKRPGGFSSESEPAGVLVRSRNR